MDNEFEDKIYEVTFSRYGVAFVKASSYGEAIAKANCLRTEDVCWDDDWDAIDAMIVDCPDSFYYE